VIRTTARVKHPDNLEVEVTISMQLAEWDKLLSQMEEQYIEAWEEEQGETIATKIDQNLEHLRRDLWREQE